MLIDTHAHLTHPSLLERIDDFLMQAREVGLVGILTVGTTLEDSEGCVALAKRFDWVRAAVGLHPNNCCQSEPEDWQRIIDLCSNPEVVAIGETGLDRYWDDCPWETQVDYFRRHIRLSRETGLPIVIHTRDCAEETLEILQREAEGRSLQGVMHSFTGSIQVAQGCLELGLYISFAGMATFKNAAEIRQVAARIPRDRILIETDSPYLTPHPFRGQRPNHPALVKYTCASLAELRQVEPVELAVQTTENARRLFHCWQNQSI
jgi:TatD DNase family protein